MPKSKLTKSALDALQARTADYLVWDEECAGFGCKVTPAGRKVFIVQYRMGGRGSPVRKYTIGPHGKLTLQQAREQARVILGQVASGADPQQQKAEKRAQLGKDRVADLYALFATQHVEQNRSARETKRIFEHDILPKIGSRSVHEIKKPELIGIIREVDQRGARIMANRVLAAMRKFFNWLVSRAIIEKSPCEGIDASTREHARDRRLSDDELRRVIVAARTMGFPFGQIVQLLIHTGQRREEVAGMRHSELDIPARTWTIPASRSKNGKAHAVHLTDATLAIIADCPRIGIHVASLSPDKPFQGWSKAKAQLDRASGVTNWRLHDLRRTMVTFMARARVAQHVSDRILNHQSGVISGVAAVYQQHDYLEERKNALELWSDHLHALVNKKNIKVDISQ